MNRKQIEKALEACNQMHREELNRLLLEWNLQVASFHWENVDTSGQVTVYKNAGNASVERRIYLATCTMSNLPVQKLLTTDFAQALLHTQPYGNAALQPFPVSVRNSANGDVKYQIVNHKGALFRTKYKALGEMKQKELRKTQFMAPKLDQDEINENKRDWMRRRVKAGAEYLKKKDEVRLQEELMQIERAAFEEGTGFGGW
jgi:hypothetical protein